VASAFIPNPYNFKHIGFRDKNPANSFAENLFWIEKDVRNSRKKDSILFFESLSDVEILNLLAKKTQAQIAQDFQISTSSVWRVINTRLFKSFDTTEEKDNENLIECESPWMKWPNRQYFKDNETAIMRKIKEDMI